MGRTVDDWNVGGSLGLTGNAVIGGGATVAGSFLVGGSTVIVGDETVSGSLGVGGNLGAGALFGVGTVAKFAAPDHYADDYSWMYLDGTQIKAAGLCLYDHHTNAYRSVYLNNGTMTAV
jgi:hypothetical protein